MYILGIQVFLRGKKYEPVLQGTTCIYVVATEMGNNPPLTSSDQGCMFIWFEFLEAEDLQIPSCILNCDPNLNLLFSCVIVTVCVCVGWASCPQEKDRRSGELDKSPHKHTTGTWSFIVDFDNSWYQWLNLGSHLYTLMLFLSDSCLCYNIFFGDVKGRPMSFAAFETKIC